MRNSILDELQGHTRDNPIPMPDLAARLGTSTRQLQHVIRQLREEGHLIDCRTDPPNNGYYLAEPEEALRVAAHLQRRGFEILKTGARLKKRALNEMQRRDQGRLF